MKNSTVRLVPVPTIQQRGPIEHERRTQIIQAAEDYFKHYGFRKTSVADLAREIGVSSAYVYRFFDSKQAIGEAVCSMALGKIDRALEEIAASEASAVTRLRKVPRTLLELGLEANVKGDKLYDLVVEAVENNWCAATDHYAILFNVVQKIVKDGREAGEFERKTPMDELCRAVTTAISIFANPVVFAQKTPKDLDENCTAITNMVLRSLAP